MKGRFTGWVILFFVILALVPVFIINSAVTIAKILGIILVVAIVAALWKWRIQTRERSPRNERIKLNTNDKFWLEKNIPFYQKLSKQDKQIFEDRVGIFLADIKVTEINKELPEKETCFYVASSAIIAYWGLPFYNYGNINEVLVYPSNFNLDNSLNRLGAVEGKVHHGGLMNNTMILSLPALVKGFQIDNDKKNVGVHEFAHLLDKSDGVIDGIPVGMEEELVEIWLNVMQDEIEKLEKTKSSIPNYAASSNPEFFAVAVEYYKECPSLLKRKHPQLFNVLDCYFNKD